VSKPSPHLPQDSTTNLTVFNRGPSYVSKSNPHLPQDSTTKLTIFNKV